MSLENVSFDDCRLSSLPDEIGALENLRYLDVADNALTELPETLKNCSKLRSLTLTGNRFSESGWKRLENLTTTGNFQNHRKNDPS